MNLYLGCPIWTFKGWIGSLFPKGTKSGDYLFEYARRLTTVEGNTTFYAVPSPETLERWSAETPEAFRFCPKVPRTISHAGKLVEHLEEAQGFIERMGYLGTRLGPMFLQLPPRYSPTFFEDLNTFLEDWPPQVRLAVEVRHPDWFDASHHQALNDLLSGLGIGRVIIDTRPIRDLRQDKILQGSVYLRLLQARERKPNLPALAVRTADFTLLRYIGHPNMEQNIPILDEWAGHLTEWLRQGAEAYVFCHCPDERLDPWLCRELHARIAAQIPIPPLPWDEAGSDTYTQARLF
jgi:uncharacterized protein YecE (DUF72 family)